MHSRPKTQRRTPWRKIFVALAVPGIVLGTVTSITPAVAYYGFEIQRDNQGNGR
jgi:hypothetical protein